jgi:hypothetical protein
MPSFPPPAFAEGRLRRESRAPPVIPAKAGIQGTPVIPAKAGIQGVQR